MVKTHIFCVKHSAIAQRKNINYNQDICLEEGEWVDNLNIHCNHQSNYPLQGERI